MIILTRRAARRSPAAGDAFDTVTEFGATVSERRHDVAMNELTVIGAAIGAAAGYLLGVFVACSVLIPEANTCGLYAVFITFPLGLLGGGAAGTYVARRWQPPAVFGAIRLIVFIGLAALSVAILLREPASRRRPAVSPAPTMGSASAAPVAATPATLEDPLRVVEVTLRAEPSSYSGPCPGRITFRGTIRTTGGSGPVSYRFTRSDRATGPVATLDVASASVREVETTWTLGVPGSVVEEWEALEVVAPQPLTSAPARFRSLCGERPGPRS
jgi:hypothetical protein